MKVKPSAQDALISVVDDDPAVLDSLILLLYSCGYRCQGFNGPEQFLKKFDPKIPGCLIFDVRMSGGSGLDLQQKLASFSYCPPIIFLTGYTEESVVTRAARQGAAEFLLKTCPEKELVSAVDRALAKDALARKSLVQNENGE